MNKKVLIVDDEPVIRILLRHTLERLDSQLDVSLAEGGEEGLALVYEDHPDLIFLDVMMPDINGYEVCRRVKAYSKDIYVILLTAKGEEIDKQLGIDAGADEYITKPFDPDLITRRVAAVLNLSL
ncbi:MAG TPA: response regulator [Chloroflexi bacterium]|nr:response regulator [Chloroflexota bacterium]